MKEGETCQKSHKKAVLPSSRNLDDRRILILLLSIRCMCNYVDSAVKAWGDLAFYGHKISPSESAQTSYNLSF